MPFFMFASLSEDLLPGKVSLPLHMGKYGRVRWRGEADCQISNRCLLPLQSRVRVPMSSVIGVQMKGVQRHSVTIDRRFLFSISSRCGVHAQVRDVTFITSSHINHFPDGVSKARHFIKTAAHIAYLFNN